jgi:hypothetical protein
MKAMGEERRKRTDTSLRRQSRKFFKDVKNCLEDCQLCQEDLREMFLGGGFLMQKRGA